MVVRHVSQRCRQKRWSSAVEKNFISKKVRLQSIGLAKVFSKQGILRLNQLTSHFRFGNSVARRYNEQAVMMIAFVENLVFFPYCGGVEKKAPKTFLNSNYGASLLKREHFFPPKISGNDHPQLPNTRAIKCSNCFPFAFPYQKEFSAKKQEALFFVCVKMS